MYHMRQNTHRHSCSDHQILNIVIKNGKQYTCCCGVRYSVVSTPSSALVLARMAANNVWFSFKGDSSIGLWTERDPLLQSDYTTLIPFFVPLPT